MSRRGVWPWMAAVMGAGMLLTLCADQWPVLRRTPSRCPR
jgi:hypothetical protein